MKPRLLHLHVKSIYFDQIKSGEKKTENRLQTDYWRKRLEDRTYDGVIIYNAYKPGLSNRITFPWNGYDEEEITHSHFGPRSVDVFAIILNPKKLPSITSEEIDFITAAMRKKGTNEL